MAHIPPHLRVPLLLSPHHLDEIARDAADYSKPFRDPRRQVQRLLAHIAAMILEQPHQTRKGQDDETEHN